MATSISLGIPSSKHIAKNTDTLEQCDGRILNIGTRMGSCVLASRSESQNIRAPTRTTESIRDSDRCHDITVPTSSADRH